MKSCLFFNNVIKSLFNVMNIYFDVMKVSTSIKKYCLYLIFYTFVLYSILVKELFINPIL